MPRNRKIKRAASIAIALGLCALIGGADYESGPSVPFLPVYFIPVVWMILTDGWQAGMAIACLNAIAWVVLANLMAGTHAPSWPPVWNGFLAILYLGVSYMLCSLKRLAELQKKWAFEDPLTGLANRRAFFKEAHREMERARRESARLTVALVDIDDFKQINDRWGHDQGDQVLIWVGQTLRSQLRSADLLARLGGDELVILLSDPAAGSARALMEKVHRGLQAAQRELGIPVSVSIGLASFQPVPATLQEMLRAADQQMYRVKRMGKNNLAYEVTTKPTVSPGAPRSGPESDVSLS